MCKCEEDKDFVCPMCNNTGEYRTRECDGTGYYETYYWYCSCKYGKNKREN